MKRIFTLLVIVFSMGLAINANAQTAKIEAADLVGTWKFMGKATSKQADMVSSDFEFTFNADNTVVLKSGEVKTYKIEDNMIVTTDKNGKVSNVLVEKFGKGEITVITDYNTPDASTSIVFKKVK